MELTINGAKVTLTHKPITLRNAETLTKLAQETRDFVMKKNGDAQRKLMVDLVNSHPDLLDVMTMTGEVNPQAVNKYVENVKKSIEERNQHLNEGEEPEVFDEAKAKQSAIEWVQKVVADMMKDTPRIAKILQYTMPTFGEDMESLVYGIGVVIGSYDSSKFNDETNANITNRDGEWWQDVTATEVAEYVNNFLHAVS